MATRGGTDSLFAKSVILLVRYDHTGALGLMVNRQTTVPIAHVLSGLQAAAGHSDTVFVGGPVELGTIFALARAPRKPEGASAIFGDIYFIVTKTALEKALGGASNPSGLRIYVGYCGWGPQQLEHEVLRGSWYIFSSSEDLAFAVKPESLWPMLIGSLYFRIGQPARGVAGRARLPQTQARMGRLAAARAALADMLARTRGPRPTPVREPDVAVLLDVDREYREKAAADKLPKIAPKRFNPKGEAWLPILHTERGDWHFTALFSNTARAHELGLVRDWVVLYFSADRAPEGQRTVVTETRGALAGRRVVRGREADCRVHYGEAAGPAPATGISSRECPTPVRSPPACPSRSPHGHQGLR